VRRLWIRRPARGSAGRARRRPHPLASGRGAGHREFERGAFTVTDRVVVVSDRAHGATGFQEALLAYLGRPPRPPQRPDWRPEPRHVDWHRREVFKRAARHYG
jgi:hypothetical protein